MLHKLFWTNSAKTKAGQMRQKTKHRDVHNIIQSQKRATRGNKSNAERTDILLNEFCGQDAGNSAKVVVDSTSKVVQAVVFLSARMKRLFEAFPEVVLVDTTHGTNRNGYKLFSFVFYHVFGKGQYVQHVLLLNETKPNLNVAVSFFKENNPAWRKIRVFISDKAFHDKAVLQAAFPDARQLL
ncbi:hypothetical protein PF004_g10751 [Phytophthora fragariae]|uniref:ZSWIM1/3 RNaseH-like domain-containing protein n=1 Tax=Phytophthora fragariae TaxID=53985 RepID=A0A6G0P021_9STRA|nr:hypothetical protein PF004_g10751 [Phytophthora fragariae]